MTDENNFVWEFACPKFVDFTDSKVLALNAEEADKYFESEHEFSFSSRNLTDCLKVESLLAKAETMASPLKTPNRPGSASSDYRTPEGREELESDEVFYTTRKYFLRITECRRLTQTGATPYRIPGSTTSKKKSRRTPFQPKVIEENAKQIEEEELLVKNLAKALFIDNEDAEPSDTKAKSCETQVENKDNNCDEKASETEDKENTRIIISEPSPEKSVREEFESTDEEEPKYSTDEEEAKESSEEYEEAKELIEDRKAVSESAEECHAVAVSVEDSREARESTEEGEEAKEKEVKESVTIGSDEKTPIPTSAPNRKPTKPHWTPTKPVSPKLTACKRKRTLTCVSRVQQEENIAQSIKKNPFKATPFNKKTYLSTANVGVRRVDPKPLTKPVPFYFHSEERIRARRSKVSADLFSKLPTKAQTTKKPQKPLLP